MSVAMQSQDTVDIGTMPKQTATQLTQARDAIERMHVRVHASHAHQQSLNCAALGVQSIHARLAPILEIGVARSGWTAANHLAASALEAMQRQLDMVLHDGDTPPIEKQRACLDHALCRATDVLVLLGGRQ